MCQFVYNKIIYLYDSSNLSLVHHLTFFVDFGSWGNFNRSQTAL